MDGMNGIAAKHAVAVRSSDNSDVMEKRKRMTACIRKRTAENKVCFPGSGQTESRSIKLPKLSTNGHKNRSALDHFVMYCHRLKKASKLQPWKEIYFKWKVDPHVFDPRAFLERKKRNCIVWEEACKCPGAFAKKMQPVDSMDCPLHLLITSWKWTSLRCLVLIHPSKCNINAPLGTVHRALRWIRRHCHQRR